MNQKLTLILIFISLLPFKQLYAQLVNFNDTNFKNILLSNVEINTNNDDEIQLTEAQAFSGKLDLTNIDIADLTGLEAFVSLTELNYWSNIATDLDVSPNISLERLRCGNLNSLVLGNNEALRYVFTDLNNFTHLTVDNSYLDSLFCWHNNGPLSVDVSTATALTYLSLNDNLISALDVSALPNLRTLYCDVNSISELNLSNNPMLEYLECKINPLSSLDLSANSNLTYIGCGHTQLTSLDVSQNTMLEKIVCYDTYLTFLDISANENLVWLDCYNASIETLNAKNGNNVHFEYFDLRENLNIECVQVDDEEYSTANWLNISNSSVYNESCDNISSSTDINTTFIKYQAYPNPTSGELNIEFDEVYDNIELELYDYNGKNIATNHISTSSSLQISMPQSSGLFLVKVRIDDVKEISFKVIKK